VSAENWLLFGSALLPVFIAIAVYYFGMKLGKRHDEQQQKLDQRG
jgi:hypothetical protein